MNDLRQNFIKYVSDLTEYSDDIYIYIWGTGNTAKLYQQGLMRENIKIGAYLDNNPPSDNKFNGYDVISVDKISKSNSIVLICTPQKNVFNEISKQLYDLEIKYCHIDQFLFSKHKIDLISAFDLLDDYESKCIYFNILKARIECEKPDAKYICDNQYFCLPDFIRSNEDIFIDCGAYIGDSIDDFVTSHNSKFNKIIAFEPDPENFDTLKKNLNSYKKCIQEKIDVYPYALSDKNSVVKVERYNVNNGLGTRIIGCSENDDDVIKSTKIDDFIECEFTFLKADIESYEYLMLLGAIESIKKYSPKLAICIYHNATDFYSITLLIKSINEKYKFAVRHHSHDVSETVLYAWV